MTDEDRLGRPRCGRFPAAHRIGQPLMRPELPSWSIVPMLVQCEQSLVRACVARERVGPLRRVARALAHQEEAHVGFRIIQERCRNTGAIIQRDPFALLEPVKIAVDEKIGFALEDEPELFLVAHGAGNIGTRAGRQADMRDREPREAGCRAHRTEIAEFLSAAVRPRVRLFLEVKPMHNDAGPLLLAPFHLSCSPLSRTVQAIISLGLTKGIG